MLPVLLLLQQYHLASHFPMTHWIITTEVNKVNTYRVSGGAGMPRLGDRSPLSVSVAKVV